MAYTPLKGGQVRVHAEARAGVGVFVCISACCAHTGAGFHSTPKKVGSVQEAPRVLALNPGLRLAEAMATSAPCCTLTLYPMCGSSFTRHRTNL